MSRNKFKLTGFARFFIVMMFLAPLAYIGASYYNGEDGIENIKNFFISLVGGESSTDSETKVLDDTEDVKESTDDGLTEQERLQREIDKKNKEIEELNRRLKEGQE